MSAAFKIRRAHSLDAPALTDVILRSKASNGYDAAFMAACADELSLTPQIIAKAPVWCADGPPLLGCVCLDVTNTTGHIKSFFIAPEAQRKGVGRALWQVVMQHAQDHSLERLILDADPAAVPFYEAMGFETFREVPSGSIPGRMLPQMQRVF